MSDCVYGFPCVENPNDFHPDVEWCSPEEIAAHAEACRQWNEGTYWRDPKKFSESFPNGNNPDDQGRVIVHVTRTPWGIGTNYFDDEPETSK